MLLRELINEERKYAEAAGKAEAVLEFLEEFGPVPEELRERILKEEDPNVLSSYIKLAARCKSTEEFISSIL